MRKTSPERGFTLIELLVVIGIIGLLASAVLVAVAPLQRLRETRNARRSSEAYSVLNAMLNKEADDRIPYDGETVAPIDTSGTTAQVIVRSTAGVTCASATPTSPSCPGAVAAGLTLPTSNLDCVTQLDDGSVNTTALIDKYLIELPIDPLGSGTDPETTIVDSPLGDGNTGYYINRTTSGRIEVGACHPDLGAIIRVKR
ncbi:MAG TPA: type II secretion system protein [Candidatus Eisenbacteria bacterium]|nr:type II secretion system protein [Candidatus Eisenbacteria bacterium]